MGYYPGTRDQRFDAWPESFKTSYGHLPIILKSSYNHLRIIYDVS